MRILATALVILMILTVATAQTRVDRCHVFVVDVKKSGKAINSFRETGNAGAKAISIGQKMFPEFRPVIGEEELTTKTYRFPGSNLIITASVFYTDESMASSQTNNSLTLGITVSRKAAADATSGEN